MSALSVISSFRAFAGRPAAPIAADTWPGSRGSSRWRGEMLTLTHASSLTMRASRRPASVSSARRMTCRPRAPIKPVSSAIGMKSSGATSGQPDGPAGQRLQRTDAPGREVDDRLVVHLEQGLLDGLAQVALARQAVDAAAVHALVEDHAAPGPAALGVVHRDVRVAQQLARGHERPRQRDADARGDEELAPVDPQRSLSERCTRSAEFDASHSRADAVEQDRELVAADPRDGVAGPQHPRDPRRQRDEELVADGMAEAVVDELEAVDVQEQDGAADVGIADRAVHDLLDAVHEQRAVGQPGQRVVQRVVLELALGSAAVVDVRQRAGHACGGAVGSRIARPRLSVQRHEPSAWRMRCSQCRCGVWPARWASIAARSSATSSSWTSANHAEQSSSRSAPDGRASRASAARGRSGRCADPSPTARRSPRARRGRSAPRCGAGRRAPAGG